MGSYESFPHSISPEETLKARNSLQLKAMADFGEPIEEWTQAGGDAELADQIFKEEPSLLERYFTFQNNPEQLAGVVSRFEELIKKHRTIEH